jgi:hypothetical protein
MQVSEQAFNYFLLIVKDIRADHFTKSFKVHSFWNDVKDHCKTNDSDVQEFLMGVYNMRHENYDFNFFTNRVRAWTTYNGEICDAIINHYQTLR